MSEVHQDTTTDTIILLVIWIFLHCHMIARPLSDIYHMRTGPNLVPIV